MNFRSYSKRSTWVTFSSRAKGTTLCVGLNILLGHLGCMGNGLEGEKARGGEKEGGVLAHRYTELQHMGNESRFSNMQD